MVFHAAFPARQPFPPIEEWLLAPGGPGRRAWFGGPGFGVSLEMWENHPVRGHGQPAVAIESSAPGDARLRGEFERAAREIFRALGVAEGADRSLLEEPRAVWNDPSGGLELRSMEIDRELGGASKIVAYDPEASAGKLLVRFVELARRSSAGETHVWCPTNPDEIGRVDSLCKTSGRWVSIDEFSAPTPDRKGLTWDEVFPIADRLSWDEVGGIWMQAPSGITRERPGLIGSKRHLRADHRLGGSRGLSIMVDVPTDGDLVAEKRKLAGELGVKIGERWPDNEFIRLFKSRARDGQSKAEEAQHRSGPLPAEVRRAIELRLGIEPGSMCSCRFAVDAFFAHSIRGWRGFLMCGRPQEVGAWAERNLNRLRELKPKIEELMKAQQELRTRLAARLGLSGPELESLLLGHPGNPGSVVWTLSAVDPAVDEIATRYGARGLT